MPPLNPNDQNQTEIDTYHLRRLSALVLVLITAGYIGSHDHNTTLEIIMLALAGFLIGTSLLKAK